MESKEILASLPIVGNDDFALKAAYQMGFIKGIENCIDIQVADDESEAVYA